MPKEQTAFKPVIDRQNSLPGMEGLLHYNIDIGDTINNLSDEIFSGRGILSRAEREYLAFASSKANHSRYCTMFHLEACKACNEGDELVPSNKLKALTEIAEFVTTATMGSNMNPHLIDNARELNVSDEEIHEAILIASIMCFHNRYVMFTNSPLPDSEQYYKEMGTRIAKNGYQII